MECNMFSKYNYVYQLYKEGSFTKAAQKLFISQPSLSSAIKKIENEVGSELFERNGNCIKLTEVGKEYIVATEKIISAEKEFKNRIDDIYNLKKGKITVGGSNYISSYILPRIVKRFTSLYPNITVNLIEGKSVLLREMIKNEELDVIIDSFSNPVNEYKGYSLVTEKIFLCVPKENIINDKLKAYQISPESIYNEQIDLDNVPTVSIEVFKNEKFILLSNGNDMYNRAMDAFGNRFNPEVIFRVEQLNLSYALTNSGMGLCFITDTFLKCANFPKNVILYNVGDVNLSRTLYIVHKQNRYCTRAMDKFIEVTREVLSK